MGGHFQPPHVGFFSDGFHLGERHLLLAGLSVVREDAAGGADLDDLGAVFADLAHALAAFIRAVGVVGAGGVEGRGEPGDVAMAAGRAEGIAGGHDAWPFDLASFNGFFQRHVVPAAGANIADGGEAGFKRCLGVRDGEDGEIGIRQADAGEAAQRRIRVDVDMHVDQAGQQGDPRQFDNFGGGGHLQRVAGADAGDLSVLDDDGRVLDHAAGRNVEHALGGDIDVLRKGGRRCGRDKQGQNKCTHEFLPNDGG